MLALVLQTVFAYLCFMRRHKLPPYGPFYAAAMYLRYQIQRQPRICRLNHPSRFFFARSTPHASWLASDTGSGASSPAGSIPPFPSQKADSPDAATRDSGNADSDNRSDAVADAAAGGEADEAELQLQGGSADGGSSVESAGVRGGSPEKRLLALLQVR